MLITIDGYELTEYPKEFKVTTVDIDDGESTVRTADGTLTRDRIAVKRQIEMAWGVLNWDTTSQILRSMSKVFFDVYYPDPLDGKYATRTFYAGNRPVPFIVTEGNDIKWNGIKVTLTER